MVAEFEADLIRLRTKEGMRIAKAKGRLRGKQPKLNPRQEAHLVALLKSGEYSTAELGDLFGVARVHRLPISRHAWHDDGMNRIRLSTTVDASLLEHARSVRSGTTDAALIDEALAALLARYRSAEVDASYAAYDEHPLEEPDEWGDLASFRRAVASS